MSEPQPEPILVTLSQAARLTKKNMGYLRDLHLTALGYTTLPSGRNCTVYRLAEIEDKLAERQRKQNEAKRGPKCPECRRRKPKAGCRGLCYVCHGDPAIRTRTAPISECGVRGAAVMWYGDGTDEMTAAELDALIAEQYPTMPGRTPQDDLEDEQDGIVGYSIPVLVLSCRRNGRPMLGKLGRAV